MIIDRSFRWIVPIVICFHLIPILLIQKFSKEELPLTSKKIIAVKTIKLAPIQATKHHSFVSKEKNISNNKIKKDNKPAKEIQKRPALSKAPTPKPPILNNKTNELLALAKEKIRKIEPSSDKILKSSLDSVSPPKAIEPFQSELSKGFGAKEIAYRDEVAARLKLHLKLPEYGSVKVDIKVERSGKVAYFKILSYESALNAEYIERNLPKVTLPSFKETENYEFTIIMSNE